MVFNATFWINFFHDSILFRVIIIIFFTVIADRIIRKLLHSSFVKSSKYLRVDPTQFNFLKHAITALIYVIGVGLAIYMVPSLRTLSVSLFAGAGVIAIIVGFASQQAFSNIISGVFIILFKPFRVGDRVKIGTDKSGIIEDITLRHTVIKNFENKRIIIPNSIISGEVIENADLTDSKICKFVEFGISYDSDIDKAMKIIQQAAVSHPYCIDNRSAEDKQNKEPQVAVRVVNLTDSSVVLRAWVWAKNQKESFLMHCDLNKTIKQAFDKNGIEIPYPHRTIVYKDKRYNQPKR